MSKLKLQINPNYSKQLRLSAPYHGHHAIVDGLTYHFVNYKRLSATVWPVPPGDTQSIYDEFAIFKMKHEAVAYLNRMGQFYYFANSKKIATQIENAIILIPTICYFMPFRNKHAAHRALDYPKQGEDENQMRFLDTFFSLSSMFLNNELIFQIQMGDQTIRRFNLLRDHQTIISEIENLITLSNGRDRALRV